MKGIRQSFVLVLGVAVDEEAQGRDPEKSDHDLRYVHFEILFVHEPMQVWRDAQQPYDYDDVCERDQN